MTSYTSIEQAAHAGANGHNSRSAPTQAQAEAGNYLKGRTVIHGMRIAIENPRGTLRKWRAADGTSGANLQKFHYGYFEGVRGADGDELDCYVGPLPESGMAYVVNQYMHGAFDEHKVMLGFPDQRTAEAGYLSNYSAGWTGLQSCIPCSIAQLKWWMANGDLSRPLTNDQLPYDERKDMDKVLWDSTNSPMGASLAQVLYQIRAHDGAEGLVFDRLSVADILADADGVLALDALVIPLAKLEPRMAILQKVMDRAGGDLTVAAMQVSDPFTQKGTTNVAVVYELSDGQTVSVFFHNPDVTPKKIMPGDDLVSWKWMLNKKDVTIAVAPERGRDLNVRTVAARIMLLAGKNSARFVTANGKRAAQMEAIEGLKGELATKEAELEDLTMQVRDAEQKAGLQPDEEVPVRDPEPQPEPELDNDAARAEARIAAAAEVARAAGLEPVGEIGNEWRHPTRQDQLTLRAEAGKGGGDLFVVSRLVDGSYEYGKFDTIDGAAKALAEVPPEQERQPEPQPAAEPVNTILTDEEVAALEARAAALREQLAALTNDELALVASTSPLSIGNAQAKDRDDLMEAIFENHPDDIEAALARWRELAAPAAEPAVPPTVDLAAHMAAQKQAREAALEAGRAAYAANADRIPPEELSEDLKRAWLEGYDTAPPPAAPQVPEEVARRVKGALDMLREIKARIDEAASLEQKFGSPGRYQADGLINRKKDIDSAQATLAEFRKLAPTNGVDAEAFIASLGGEPDLTPSPEAAEWLKPKEPAAADDFNLTGESAEEARARIEQEEAAAAAKAAADRAAEKAAREEQERKEIAARQAASAENFELGQSPEDSLSGQRSLMDPPPEPAANPAVTFLQSVIDGTTDLGAASLAGDLSNLHAENKDDPEFMALFKQAVKAYSAYAIAQANAAMAVAA